MTVYAYYRVSTDKQDYENQKTGVVEFSKRQNLPIEVEVIDDGKSGTLAPEKRQLGQLLGIVKEDDVIIAAEISRLTRKLCDLFKIASYLSDKKVKLYTVKDNYTLDTSIQGQAVLFAFGLAAQIERDMLSQRVREALARKKKEGIRLGRPRGSRYSKLAVYDEYIRKSVEDNISLAEIARRVGCDWNTLRRYCNRNNIETSGRVIVSRKRKSECYNVDYSKSYVEAVNKDLVVYLD
jgi:DNA invertase Pin-like site-specific DNA recombinase